jgi:Spy/CpxP family protein refolding chaperone
MKNLLNSKIVSWLIALLVVANITTLAFFWIGHFKNQKENSPKEFLSKNLNFSKSQKNAYFILAKEHNESAKIIREQIKNDKESLFQLLKSDTINDSVRNDKALKVSMSIQALDILTFEHFRKVRAICTEEQKPKFDELMQKMVNAVNQFQKGPPPSLK